MRKICYRVASSWTVISRDRTARPTGSVQDAAIDFRALLAQFDALLVDALKVATMPALSSGGIPLFPATGAAWKKLGLNDYRIYRESGLASLTYDVIRDSTR